MKYQKVILLIVLGGTLLAACRQPSEHAAAPVQYELKSISKTSPGGCASDTTPCATISISYPVFSGIAPAADTALRARIAQALAAEDPSAEGMNIEGIANHFIDQFTTFVKAQTDAGEKPMGGNWTSDTHVVAELLTDTLISLSVNSEFYTGGAHGGMGVGYINVDPLTGNEVTLRDFFLPGYEADLTRAGEHAFRNVRQLADTASLSANGFEFKNDTFALNDNYGFKKEGIVFFYNGYEIAPYAIGPTEILIPYEELRAWMKKRSR